MKGLISSMFVALVFLAAPAFSQSISVSPKQVPTGSAPNYARAQAMPLPQASHSGGTASPFKTDDGKATPGYAGTGGAVLATVPTGAAIIEQLQAVPEQFGTSEHPFTTARANPIGDPSFVYYPFRPTGRLFFNIGAATYVCSASLIKPGVIVTAAHCVANFGHSQFYSNWTFLSAYFNGSSP